MEAQTVPHDRRCLPRTEILFVAVALTLILMASVPCARAAMTLDQQHLVESGAVVFNDTQSMAQTFTPAITGQLAQVDVKAWNDGGQPATMSIQTVAGGMPSGTTLGSVDIALWTPSSWNSADFLSESVHLTAGEPYAIVLSGNGGGDAFNSIAVNWMGDTYPGGRNWALWWSGAASWSAYAPDAVFQTWMDAENVIPAPGSLVLVSIGVGLLGRLRRRRFL